MLNFSRQLFHRQMRASSIDEAPDWDVAVVVVEGAGVVALEVELSPPDWAAGLAVVVVASVGAGGADMVGDWRCLAW